MVPDLPYITSKLLVNFSSGKESLRVLIGICQSSVPSPTPSRVATYAPPRPIETEVPRQYFIEIQSRVQILRRLSVGTRLADKKDGFEGCHSTARSSVVDLEYDLLAPSGNPSADGGKGPVVILHGLL